MVEAEHLVGECVTRRVGRVAADDGRRADDAGTGKTHVHGAAAAAAIAGCQAHDFRHEAIDRLVHTGGEVIRADVETGWNRRIEQFQQHLVVGAVRAVDLVVGAERGHGADRTRFLPDAGMGRAVDQAGFFQIEQLFLEPADQEHLAVPVDQVLSLFPAPVRFVQFQPEPGRGRGEGYLACHSCPRLRFSFMEINSDFC